MCGLSASLLFALVTRLVEREVRFSSQLASPGTERTELRLPAKDFNFSGFG
jgi:hypothetical protein